MRIGAFLFVFFDFCLFIFICIVKPLAHQVWCRSYIKAFHTQALVRENRGFLFVFFGALAVGYISGKKNDYAENK